MIKDSTADNSQPKTAEDYCDLCKGPCRKMGDILGEQPYFGYWSKAESLPIPAR